MTGPKQLLDLLLGLAIPADPRPLCCHAWLDAGRKLLRVDAGEEELQPVQPESAAYLVQVLVLSATETDPDRLQRIRDFRDLPMPSDCHTLDRLVVCRDRWWSALCHDSNCCPSAGRAISARLRLSDTERRSAWLALQSTRDRIPADGIAPEIARLLVDRPLRDCVLADLGHRPERRGDWQRVLLGTEPISPQVDAVVATLLAAISYLASDMAAASLHLQQARKADPEYSLAGLLQQGLDIGAGADLALSAFCAYQCEELLELAATGEATGTPTSVNA